jgi:lipopolysaccharide transport system ATP-binding protein
MDIVINAKNLCIDYKMYEASRSLRKIALKSFLGGTFIDNRNEVVLRAINQISFVIKKGEKVGLVGSNGSGKSTLLKVIAGIFAPVFGTIDITGEVGSLIDISAGIESEADCLTNIRLLGLVRGLTLSQIKKIENEIIEFSDLNANLHLPFKNLSTGMSMRLLFSVATTIVPDILVLDELIGAGDEEFKEKASKRLNDIVSSNRTLVLASHDLDLLKRTCNRLMILSKGSLVYDGSVGDGLSFVKNQKFILD